MSTTTDMPTAAQVRKPEPIRSVSLSPAEAFEMAKIMASRGVFVGQSSGAYLVAAIDAAAQKGARVVTIFNDLGERYFSTGMWD